MGSCIISFYQYKIKREWKIAFYSALICFVFIHFYKITNYLPNHDTLYNFYSTQDITASGRWFLQYACGISSYFDLTWLNGVLCAVYLGITSAIVTELLGIQNPVVIALTSMVLVGTPSTTEMLFFGYTADGYLLGLTMSALAACLSCRKGSIVQYALSGLLLCFSCAIYQSNVSFAVMLCICYLILKLLDGEISVSSSWSWIGRHVLLYGAALICYYVIWKLILHLNGSTATSYQGIDSLGKISISTLIHSAITSIANIALFFLEWNILEHPISLYAVLNIIFLVCFVAVLLIALIKSGTHRSVSRLSMVLFCLAATIPVLSVWNFISPTVIYRPMMLHGICLYFTLALILFDKWVPSRVSTCFAALIAVIIFNFGVMANISYFWLNKCYEKTYFRGSAIMTSVVNAQYQYDNIESIAFTGNRTDEVYSDDSVFTQKVHILSMCLETDLLYDHFHTYLFLEQTFDLSIPDVTEQKLYELEDSAHVQEMPTWPAEGSCQVIDGTLVIKIGD